VRNRATCVRALIAAAVVASACRPASTNGSSDDIPVATTDTLQLRHGESMRTRDREMTVTFLQLVSDSRCRKNVVCVWQGDAAVRLKAVASDGTVEATIHTALDPKQLSLGTHTLSVIDVRPYPGSADSTQAASVVLLVR